MTAQEFFEQNRGKYFMYDGEKVKLVGYRKDSPPKYLIITYSDGWTNEEDYNVIDPSLIDSESLFDGEWRFYYVVERQLNPVEPQEINLCEILKGCEGIGLWSDIFGKCKLESLVGDGGYEIVVLVLNTISYENEYEQFTKYGRFYDCYPNGKCMLWPSETNRDWSTFKKPIKIKEGDPVMCFNGICNSWVLRKYNNAVPVYYKHIVPATEFDFSDIESNKSKSII